jgi:hypothetical protein
MTTHSPHMQSKSFAKKVNKEIWSVIKEGSIRILMDPEIVDPEMNSGPGSG